MWICVKDSGLCSMAFSMDCWMGFSGGPWNGPGPDPDPEPVAGRRMGVCGVCGV